MMTQHSIDEKTLPKLKKLALEELELTKDEVMQHGDLRLRSTWIEAIRLAQRAGKTTQGYRELPIIKKLTVIKKLTEAEASGMGCT